MGQVTYGVAPTGDELARGMALRDRAIGRYHAMLTPEIGSASHDFLEVELRRAGLFFGDRPLCSVLRPRLLSVAEHRMVAWHSAHVLAAFEKARIAAMADAVLREQFGLLAWEERLIHDDPGYRVSSPLSRLDAFFADGADGLKFTEYNAETPAGAAYNDALAELFQHLPVMGEFLREFACVPLPAGPGVVRTLLETFAEWRGVRERPRIAILDWINVPTASEFELFRQRFAKLGLECVIADPRDTEYRDGKLFAGDVHVTLIYKRVLIDELVRECGENHHVVRAVRDGAVCMVNPFRCKLLHKKASLAVLSDEVNRALFSSAEVAAIDATVPWTRVVRERRTIHDGTPIDLLPWIARNRERLVLKPNDEYGGKGIVLGWTVDEAAWEAAIRVALAEPYIVQERVLVPSEGYPGWHEGGVVISDRMLDTAPFMSQGSYMEGCLTRISTDPLLNVTAGGGSNIPTFLVEDR